MNQTPSIGRIVHYQSFGTPNNEHQSKPRAAVITAVWGPIEGEEGRRCSLCIMNPTGLFFNETVPFSAEPRPGYWSWPPRSAP